MLALALTFLLIACALTEYNECRMTLRQTNFDRSDVTNGQSGLLFEPQRYQVCYTIELQFPKEKHVVVPDNVVPNYIKKALREKNQYTPQTRAKTRTIHNLTMKEVIDHVKDITRALNYNAKKNGYKVDYKFRVVDNFF